MRSRVADLLLVALLLASALPTAAQAATYPNLELGFDQSSLTPLSQGTPFYTWGDQVWIVSNYNSSKIAELTPPTSPYPVAFSVIYPGQPVSLYTFKLEDPLGTWTLTLSDSSGPVAVVGVNLVGPPGNVTVSFEGASLGQGYLSTSFELSAEGAYDLQACALGSKASGPQLPIPPSVGTGLLALNIAENSFNLQVRGAVSDTTEFWFELYHPYSFQVGGTNGTGFFTREILSATSSRVVLGQENSSSGLVSYETGSRNGRYVLRAYFRSAQGLRVVEAPLLLEGYQGWLALSDCVASSQPAGLSFGLRTSLQAPPEDWPRQVLVMFRAGGLESYATVGFDPGLSAATLVGSPWNQTLTDLNGVASGPGIEGSQTVNGTMYVLSSAFPVSANVAISLGSRTYETLEANLAASYTKQTLMVPVGKLVAQTTINGAPDPGVKVVLQNQANSSVTKASNGAGTVTFYVPEGNYSLRAGLGAAAASSVRVASGQETNVTLELRGQQWDTTVLGLAGVGAVGVAANLFVWWRWWRNRKIAAGRPG